MSIVCKFGGSSMANATQFKKVRDIVIQNPERRGVVVSAIGKSKSTDNKITDLLYLLFAHIKYKVNYDSIFNQIKERYFEVKNDLNLDLDLQAEFDTIEKNMKVLNQDYLVSRGEYLAAKLMASYIGCKFIDAADVMRFNFDGSVNYNETTKLIKEAAGDDLFVMPGFYGSYETGEIHLFSRGGSDVSGSIVARALEAEVYENWTDVSGILMADPRVVDNPRKITKITYEELRELSYMGASVLHQDAIFPIEDSNIPINIRNTNAPEDAGTIISATDYQTDTAITGLAGKKNFTSIMVIKKRFAKKIDVLSQIFNIFKKFNLNIELVPTGVDAFSFVVETQSLEKIRYKVMEALNEIEDIVSVETENNIALVAVVGKNMAYKPGFSGKVFAVLGDNGISVKVIAQGSHEFNIIIGVDNKDFEKAIKVIYNNLVE
jgi:aspartate kinase